MLTSYQKTWIRLTFFCLLYLANQLTAQSPDKIQSIIEAADTLASDSLKIRYVLSEAGKMSYPATSLPLLIYAEEKASRFPDSFMYIHTSYAKGNFHFYAGQSDSADYYYDRGLSISHIVELPMMKASMLTAKGGNARRGGDLPRALRLLLSGREIYESIDVATLDIDERRRKTGLQGIQANSIANIYLELKDYDNVEKYYDFALESFLSNEDYFLAGVIKMNKGVMYNKKEEYFKAKEALQKAISYYEKDKRTPPKRMATVHSHLGVVENALGNRSEAEKLFQSSLNYFSENNDKRGEMLVRNGYGNMLLTDDRLQSAQKMCQEAYFLSNEYNDVETRQETCKCLYEVYKSTGNYTKALSYYEEYSTLKDSVFNADNVRNLTALELQYQYDKENEIRELEAEAQRAQFRLITYALAGGLLALAIIALLLYRLIRIRRKANIKLKEKNEQISEALADREILLKEIHHRVKNNLQVISSLLNIQGKMVQDPIAREAIIEGKNRVTSMALIHQNLYQEGNLVGVFAQEYIDKLLSSIMENYQLGDKVVLETDIDPIKLDVDTIIPLGLVINELVSNSLKYAFQERESGTINIILKKRGAGIILTVKDNGVGLPESFDQKTQSSMGFVLIRAFTRKLGAKLDISDDAGSGTSIILDIPKVKAA